MKRSAVLLALLLCSGAAARAEVVDGVAAIVGDEVVLLSEVRTAMQSVLARVPQGQQLSPDELRQLRDGAVKGLIDDKLVLQIARQQGVVASEEEIDDAVSGIAQEENMTVDVQPNGITKDHTAGVQVGELIRITRTGVERLHKMKRGMFRAGQKL